MALKMNKKTTIVADISFILKLEQRRNNVAAKTLENRQKRD